MPSTAAPSPLLAPASAILDSLFTTLPPSARTAILHRLITTPSNLPLETRVRRAALAEARPPNAMQQALAKSGLSGRKGKNVKKRGSVRRAVVRITVEGERWRGWGAVEQGRGAVEAWVEEEEGESEEEDYEVIELEEVRGVAC